MDNLNPSHFFVLAQSTKGSDDVVDNKPDHNIHCVSPNKNSYVIEVPVPGISSDNLEVTVVEGAIKIANKQHKRPRAIQYSSPMRVDWNVEPFEFEIKIVRGHVAECFAQLDLGVLYIRVVIGDKERKIPIQ